MASILPNRFRRAKKATRFAGVDQKRDGEARKMAYHALEADTDRGRLREVQAALEHYPLCADAWAVLGYHYCSEPRRDLPAAIEAFRAGVKAARRVRPFLNPDRTERIDWSSDDIEPYYRVMRGLTRAYVDAGRFDDAIETGEQLLRRACPDVEEILFGWYIKAGRWEDARLVLPTGAGAAVSCETKYTSILLHYHDYTEDPENEELEERLHRSLGSALETNIYVPTLLTVDSIEHRPNPMFCKPGGAGEALMYAIDCSDLWKKTTGAMEWLLAAKERYGPKPTEELFVRWLRCRSVYVEFFDRPPTTVTIVNPKGCARSHDDGSVVRARSSEGDWMEFRYDDVARVPFWSVLLENDHPSTTKTDAGTQPETDSDNLSATGSIESQDEDDFGPSCVMLDMSKVHRDSQSGCGSSSEGSSYGSWAIGAASPDYGYYDLRS